MRDVTTQVVIVLWDETATELTKSSAKALLDGLEAEDEEDAPPLPAALTNTYGSVHVFEIKSHTYYNHAEYESFTCTGVFPVERPADSDVQQVSVVSDDLAPESSNSQPKASLKRLKKGPRLNTPTKYVECKKNNMYSFRFIFVNPRFSLIFWRNNPDFSSLYKLHRRGFRCGGDTW